MTEATAEQWIDNIERADAVVRRGAGFGHVGVVTGSARESEYWRSRLTATAADVLGPASGVSAVTETTPRGNFFGTVAAWSALGPTMRTHDLSALAMVFGAGKRLSPFTQALGNCKAALPTPKRGAHADVYLTAAELSLLHAGTWAGHLRDSGFRGVIIKWGDEAIVSGLRWPAGDRSLADVDAVRFVWTREPDEALAREKDWLIIDNSTGLLLDEVTRQPLQDLRARAAELATGGVHLAVNLGSLAVTTEVLDIAVELLGNDAIGRADWDPFVWMALCQPDREAWERALEREDRSRRPGLAKFVEALPDLFDRLHRLRREVEHRRGRPFRIATLDFGPPLWIDFGLHQSLRGWLQPLPSPTPHGRVLRTFFGIDGEPDAAGNVILRSRVPAAAGLRDSLIVDSVIESGDSTARTAVIIGSRLGRVSMPAGGAALFSTVGEVTAESDSIAFRAVADRVHLPSGSRMTSLFTGAESLPMMSNESLTSYDGSAYDEPVFGNPISFRRAAELMAGTDPEEVEQRWRAASEPA